MSRECWGCMVKPSERAKCEERSRTGFKEWQQHHVLPQQILKREGYGDLLGDERNLIWMREYHHLALESRFLTIFFEDVPAVACEFAAELGLSHHLERLYPPVSSLEPAFEALSRAAVTPAPKYPVPRAELVRGEYDARSMRAGAAVLVGCWPDDGEGERSEFRDGWMAAARHLRAVADACDGSDVENLEAPREERWEP